MRLVSTNTLLPHDAPFRSNFAAPRRLPLSCPYTFNKQLPQTQVTCQILDAERTRTGLCSPISLSFTTAESEWHLRHARCQPQVLTELCRGSRCRSSLQRASGPVRVSFFNDPARPSLPVPLARQRKNMDQEANTSAQNALMRTNSFAMTRAALLRCVLYVRTAQSQEAKSHDCASASLRVINTNLLKRCSDTTCSNASPTVPRALQDVEDLRRIRCIVVSPSLHPPNALHDSAWRWISSRHVWVQEFL